MGGGDRHNRPRHEQFDVIDIGRQVGQQPGGGDFLNVAVALARDFRRQFRAHIACDFSGGKMSVRYSAGEQENQQETEPNWRSAVRMRKLPLAKASTVMAIIFG